MAANNDAAIAAQMQKDEMNAQTVYMNSGQPIHGGQPQYGGQPQGYVGQPYNGPPQGYPGAPVQGYVVPAQAMPVSAHPAAGMPMNGMVVMTPQARQIPSLSKY